MPSVVAAALKYSTRRRAYSALKVRNRGDVVLLTAREGPRGLYFVALVRSSKGDELYRVVVTSNGEAWCTCPDFAYRGLLCKHIIAALIEVSKVYDVGEPRPKPPSSPISESRAPHT